MTPMRQSYRLLCLALTAACHLLMTSCGQDPPPVEDPPLYPYGGPSVADIERTGNPFPDADALLERLEAVYCDPEACEQWIKTNRKGLSFEGRTIRWGTPPRDGGKGWRAASEMPPMASSAKPLEGVRIGIDAGHIGGKWSTMEFRDNMIAGKYRVLEGVSTQIVASHLARLLRKMGAEVLLVREGSLPVSKLNPDIIADRLAKQRGTVVTTELQREAQQWFIRRAEINARAAKLRKFRPDLTVCLHFDAGNVHQPVDRLHLIINGSYTRSEIADDELRLCMIAKLLEKVYDEEVAVCSSVAASMAAQLKLPALSYGARTESVRPVPYEPYLWCRNLLANALYPGPVVYTEPYAMNNVLTARRMVVGDYDGTKVFDGVRYRSIYREYAESVAEGIRQHFASHRPSL